MKKLNFKISQIIYKISQFMTNCSDKQLILVTRQGIEIGEIQNYLSRVYDILKHWQSNINDNVLTHSARDNVLTHPARDRDNVLTHPARDNVPTHPARDNVLTHPARDNVLTHPARDNVLTHPARDNVLTHPARLFLRLCIAYIY